MDGLLVSRFQSKEMDLTQPYEVKMLINNNDIKKQVAARDLKLPSASRCPE